MREVGEAEGRVEEGAALVATVGLAVVGVEEAAEQLLKDDEEEAKVEEEAVEVAPAVLANDTG